MKTKLLLSLLIGLTTVFSVFSQVGIGTVVPDPSSVLDVTSTTQGLLTPRMTTIQKNAIASPVKGLLVFDIDTNAFNFYDGVKWVELAAAVKRDNYKLVKSIADLSDELVAGGNTSYQLNTNYLYEINGAILFDFPIDLNGAYLEGVDVSSDILVNNSGSALFTGNKGGSFRNLTINANGKAVFDINGSTTSENIIANSIICTGASSIGTISNMGVVFFNVSQFVGNTDGLSISDISTFFMTSVFWTDSNTGTFLKVSGNISDFQIANGRVVANSGETGIDVSANPIISVSGSISGVNFTGEGLRVKGYTSGGYGGYNFTNDWDINSPGIKLETDNNAIGDINLNGIVGTGFNTSFTGTGTSSRTKLAGATTSNDLFRFITSSENNRIIYDGLKNRSFQISASLSFRGYVNNTIIIFYLAKGNNGDAAATVIEQSRVYREVGDTNDIGAVAIIGSIALDPGDFIEVWVERYSGGGDILTVSLNLVAN